jgi:hypothetical protein
LQHELQGLVHDALAHRLVGNLPADKPACSAIICVVAPVSPSRAKTSIAAALIAARICARVRRAVAASDVSGRGAAIAWPGIAAVESAVTASTQFDQHGLVV